MNGFVVGQYLDVLTNALGPPMREDTTADGWIYRTYLVDRATRSYMSFKFPSRDANQFISVQIAGAAGTPMLPFLGIRLGDSRASLERVFGRPSRVNHDPQWKVDYLQYAGRNYSFEIDSTRRVSSIQILGFEGFPEKPPPSEALASIDPLRSALIARDIERLVSLLAPDIELFHGDQVTHYRTAARRELADSTSPLTRALLGPSPSLRAVFAEEHADGDPVMRVYERAPPGTAYKFAGSKIVDEIVFQHQAGRWKAWEIRFR